MSLFIASQAFPVETDFAAVKIAIFAGSILAAIIGVAILWNARSDADSQQDTGNK
jgi:NhaA family Na+:H+ antiporter